MVFAVYTNAHQKFVAFCGYRIYSPIILLLTAIVFHVFFAQQGFAKYYSNPVNTEFTEIIPANGELIFPAVTICS